MSADKIFFVMKFIRKKTEFTDTISGIDLQGMCINKIARFKMTLIFYL